VPFLRGAVLVKKGPVFPIFPILSKMWQELVPFLRGAVLVKEGPFFPLISHFIQNGSRARAFFEGHSSRQRGPVFPLFSQFIQNVARASAVFGGAVLIVTEVRIHRATFSSILMPASERRRPGADEADSADVSC
jgi:hypothetical protein